MRKVFICEKHEEYGTLGWRPESNPGFDPLSGMAVAHDTLEHARDTTESVADELQALGAMIHVRGQAYFARLGKVNTQPSYHMSSELLDMLRKISAGEISPIEDHRATECAEISAELDALIEYIRAENQAEYNEAIEISEDTIRNIRAWVTIGYRKAKKRYAQVDALTMFIDIESRADEFLCVAEEGDKLTVHVRNGETFIYHTSRYDE